MAEQNPEPQNEAQANDASQAEAPQTEAPPAEEQHELTYHAVEKDGQVTAIWEMKGRKHVRTIDPRSEEGRHILGSHEVDENAHDDQAQAQTSNQ